MTGDDLGGEGAASSTAFSARCVDSVAKASWSAREKRIFLRGGLGEHAHELAVERALQAVVEHVVEHFAVAHAHAGARLGK